MHLSSTSKIKQIKHHHQHHHQVVHTNSVLNYLLLLKHNLKAIDKLRNVKPYELIKIHTDRFKKTFIPYGLKTFDTAYAA